MARIHSYHRIASAIAEISILLALLIFCACSSSSDIENRPTNVIDAGDPQTVTPTNPFATQLPSCSLEVVSYEIDTLEESIEFTLDVLFPSSQWDRRVLNLDTGLDKVDNPTFKTTLSDTLSNKMFESEFWGDKNGTGKLKMAEWTDDDTLTIQIVVTDSTITEYYIYNGNAESYVINSGDRSMVDNQRDACWIDDSYQYPRGYDTLPEENREVVEACVDFESFYDWDNSLQDNQEGLLIADLLSSQDFADWIDIELGDTLGELPIEWHETCDYAMECVLIKCPMGGDLNLLCDFCVLYVLVCVVVEILNSF